ncbi:tetratricopeptide repeat protein [Nonomuraea sp. NPDC052129]|uniref:tetratricopeptide repeat protein n=1 Tax=Nonomuraea sp. NPDC052129 TaxID=3154651 RepID=UPI00342F1780
MNHSEKALAAARNLVDLRRWQDALDALGPALVSDDTAAEAHRMTARCLLSLGRTKDAHNAVVSALRIDPGSEYAHYLLASVLLGLGRRGAALRAATEAARLAPDWVPSLYILAKCRLEVFERDEAQRTAAMAVRADPHDPLAHLAVAEVAVGLLPLGEVEADRERWDEAERAFRTGLGLDPHDEDLALGLAHLLCLRHRFLEAAEIYLTILRSNPSNDLALRAIGLIGVSFGQLRNDWNNAAPVGARFQMGLANLDSPSIEALLADFISLVSESQETVRESLSRATNLLSTVSRSFGGGSHQAAEPMPATDFGVPLSSGWSAVGLPTFTFPWHALDLTDDPLPANQVEVASLAGQLQDAVKRVAEYDARIRALLYTSRGVYAKDDDGARLHEIFVEMSARTGRIADIYRDCGDILLEFSHEASLARAQVVNARHWADHANKEHETAVQMFLSLLAEPRPQGGGDWRGLDESAVESFAGRLSDSSSMAAARRFGREAREWEEERQGAISSARNAMEVYREAEAGCVQALRLLIGKYRPAA